MNGPYIDPKDLQPDTSNTNKDSGSGEDESPKAIFEEVRTFLREEFNVRLDTSKAEAAIYSWSQRQTLQAQLQAIDKVFQMSPGKSFNQWKPTDAFRFYERLKAYEQELTQQLNDMEEK
jgi:hypothetical protein